MKIAPALRLRLVKTNILKDSKQLMAIEDIRKPEEIRQTPATDKPKAKPKATPKAKPTGRPKGRPIKIAIDISDK